MLYTAGKYEEGLTAARTGIELDANSFLSHRVAGLCLIALNRGDEAIEVFNHLMSISNRHQNALCGLIWAYCGKNMLPEAQKLMDELIKRGEKEYISPAYAAISAAHLDQLELAFEFLESAFRDKDPILVTLKYGPFVPQALRINPRFKEMLDRMKFPN